MTNKDIEEFEKQMNDLKEEKIKPMTREEEYRNADVPMPDERGPGDLEKRIQDLMKISLSHQNLNADLRKDNVSGVKGVCFKPANNKWQAQISIKGKQTYLGLFETIGEAEEVMKAKRKDLHGEFTNNGELS